MLIAAYQAGGLPIYPHIAEAALETFERLARYNRPGKSAVRKLCDGELVMTGAGGGEGRST